MNGRLLRSFMFTALSVAGIVAFVAVGHWTAQPLRWTELGAWLDTVDPADALVELARWVGLLLAIYVAVVSATASAAELTALARLPGLSRVLRRVVGLVALPALRRRLLEFTTVATVTAATLHAVPGSASSATASSTLVVAAPQTLTSPLIRGEFEGFDISGVQVETPSVAATHTVQPGDTLWEIVERHYGRVDGELLQMVAAANPQIADVNLILVGWSIALPDIPRAGAADAKPAIPAVDGEASWAVVVVQAGDTLWDIVDHHYGHATAELVWATVEATPDIKDPDLLHVGQLVTLPPGPVDLVDPQSPPLVRTEPREAPSPPTRPDDQQAPPVPTDGSPPLNEPSITVLPAVDPTIVDDTRSRGSLPAAGPVATPFPTLDAASDSTEATEENGPSLAEVIGWSGGAGLAVALLGLASRRRRRMPTAGRLRRLPKRSVEVAVALRETDHVSMIELAACALRSMASGLRPRPGEPSPMPRLLRLAAEEVELVWDTPNGDAIEPWKSTDGGWSWTLRPLEPSRPNDAPAPCPTLVTIGSQNGDDVLLNLESCGALAVVGDPSVVRPLCHSMMLELAASSFADAPTVLVVGDLELAASPEHARRADVVEALGWLRDRCESAGALLAHRRLTSLFALRARSRSHDAHEPVVVYVDSGEVDAHELTQLVQLANGDVGAIVVVAGEHPSISWRLECSETRVVVQPLGLVLESTGLSDGLVAAIEEFVPPADPTGDDFDFDERDIFEHESADPVLILEDHLQIVRLEQRSEPVPLDDDTDCDVELKVLGQVRSLGTKEPLSPTELHLAIYLAFHRTGENADTISTMVWPKGAAPRTVTNAMASLRRKLGTGSDGQPLFPLGRDNQYVYRLSPRVITDWDRFVAFVERAKDLPPDEALPLLDAALELVDGPPFRAATGYSWAYGDGTATLITETVRAVGLRCADLHAQRSELAEAGAAASRSMRVTSCADDDTDVCAGTGGLGE